MDESHAMKSLAICADSWFSYPTTVNRHSCCVTTNRAAKEGYKMGVQIGEMKLHLSMSKNKPSRISGISEDIRTTIPLMVIS